MNFVEEMGAAFPELKANFEEFGALYEKKLWHQLTVALDEFLKTHANKLGPSLIEMYTKFISHFEARLSQVRLVLLVSMIGHSFDEPERSLELFNSVLKSRTRLGIEASLCIDMDITLINIRVGNLDMAKVALEEAKEKILSFSSSETAPFSKFYKASAAYRKAIGPAGEFYKAALMYLSYTPMDALSDEEKYDLATDVAMSAITGEDIYNFGEVLATPILSHLEDTSNQWMCDLVVALHEGSIDKFNTIVDSNRDKYSSYPTLVDGLPGLKKKVVLLALINIAFERNANDRQISFSDIAGRTHIDMDQVEWVIMRAMSLNLVRGSIDQVEQFVNITWVQPRILDKQQIGVVADQLEGWASRVKDAYSSVEDQTSELLA